MQRNKSIEEIIKNYQEAISMYDECESLAKASAERKNKDTYGADEIAEELEKLVIPLFQDKELTNKKNYRALEELIKNWDISSEKEILDEDKHKCAVVQQILLNVLREQKNTQLKRFANISKSENSFLSGDDEPKSINASELLPEEDEEGSELLPEEKAELELLKITRGYLTHLFAEAVPYALLLEQQTRNKLLDIALKNDPLLNEKYKQCTALLSILRQPGPTQEKLKDYREKVEEYKKLGKLAQHRKPKSDKAENILRGFGAFLASCTVILIPVVAYKAYHGTLFKRTEGEQMLEKAEDILKKHNIN